MQSGVGERELLAKRGPIRLGLWLAALTAACGGTRAGERVQPAASVSAARDDGWRTLDAFEVSTAWSAESSDDVSATKRELTGREGHGLAVDFDFRGHGGYASLKRALPLALPEHFELRFALAGEAPVNDFQLKFADESGENVWWFRKNDFVFSPDFREITVKQRQIEFAWGPTKERAFKRAASVEFVVAAGREGGRGWFAVDALRLRALPAPAKAPAPVASASSQQVGGEAGLALDGKIESAWRSDPAWGKAQLLTIDLGVVREFGGLVLRWQEGAGASDYDVTLSRDGASFEPVRRVRGGDGGRDALRLPESEARFVRLALRDGPAQGYALAELELKELSFGASENAFVGALARESPRGHYPRGFSGEQPYWTIVGADGSPHSGLLSEDGALEVGAGGFSVEPFVVLDGRLISWADVQSSQALADGYLPSPNVRWQHPDFGLEVEAFASGGEQPELWGRYTLENRRATALALKFVLAVRPYQVNPPTQFLNIAGGVSPIRALSWDGSALAVSSSRAVPQGGKEERLLPLRVPDHVALASFDGGGFPERALPSGGRAPQTLTDPIGLASGALVYELSLPPGQKLELGLLAPLGSASRPRDATMADLNAQRTKVLAEWREKLGRVQLRVPVAGQRVVDSLRSALAHILVSRAGAVLRPGTRSYARSWIRDGAMMAEALLQLGHEEVAQRYLDWFAPYLFANGKVPCCVDFRGADPVVENDSAGEFIFLVGELYRFTRQRERLEALWPRVAKAVDYMETLRASERAEQNRAPSRRAFYGLMPRSISHEGYSDRPAYSYWDDFWALIGYEDAATLAGELGHGAEAQRFGRARDEFKADLLASLRESAAQHGVDYLPGSADRGDFDATSTTIALSPGRLQDELVPAQLAATFERYYREFQARRDGKRSWQDYTPYELRTVASFVRLGQRARAEEQLAFFFGDQRPPGWNQWAEVVGREPREPRFIGDMPHAWIASDYIRSALELFAYARPNQGQLVLAAGVPLRWFEGKGVALERLRTHYGQLSYTARRRGKQLLFEIKGAAPPGGFVIPWPAQGTPGRATVDGKPAQFQDGELRVARAPARVVLEAAW